MGRCGSAMGGSDISVRHLLRMWWPDAKRVWRAWSEILCSDGPVRWSRKVRIVLSWWWSRGLLAWVAKMVARKTDAGFTAKVRASGDLLDTVLVLHRIVECPGPGWEGVETSRFAYDLARARRFFVRQRLYWVQAKLEVAQDELRREMDESKEEAILA